MPVSSDRRAASSAELEKYTPPVGTFKVEAFTHSIPVAVVCSTYPLAPALYVLSYSAPVRAKLPSTDSFCAGDDVPIPTLPLPRILK